MPDLFISYSRKDTEFVKKLTDSLAEFGRDVWVDWEDIPLTADWWAEIQQGIDESNAFIFIISPDSVSSEVCQQELDHAINIHKRFVPVLYREVNDPELRAKMNPAISTHNWLFFRETDDYEKAVQSLNNVVDMDLSHVKNHTRLLTRAKEWDRKGHKSDLLLSGEEISEAEQWLSEAIEKDPRPSELHSEYIFRSRAAASQRQQRLLAGVTVALIISTVLAIAAVIGFTSAERNRQEAERNRQVAEHNAEVSNSLTLATSSQLELDRNLNDLALLLALESVEIDDPPLQSRGILEETVFSPGTASVFTQHNDTVYHITTSADGERVLSADREGRILVWDLETQDILLDINGQHEERVRMAIFSPDETHILSTSQDNTIRLWDAETGEQLQIYEGEHEAQARAIVFLPDGERFLSASDDGTVILWDVDSADVLQRYGSTGDEEQPGHTASIQAIDIMPDGNSFISGDNDSNIIQWDIETGEIIQTFSGHEDVITSIHINANGTRMLSGSGDRSIRLWNVETGESIYRMEGHTFFVKEALFVPGTPYAFSVGDDTTTILWNLNTGEQVERFADHTGFVDAAATLPNGRFALSGGGDSIIRYWRLLNGSIIRNYYGHNGLVNDVVISSDDSRVLSAAAEIILWDAETGEPISTYNTDNDGHNAAITALALSPDETTFVSSAEDTTIVLWDMATGDILQTFEDGHEAGVLIPAVNISPDGSLLASGAGRPDNDVILWDVQTGEIVQRLEGHENTIEDLQFSADGSQIFTASQDATLRLWDVETGEQTAIFEGHTNPILSLAISPDGTTVATASTDTTIRIWNIADQQTTTILQGHTSSVENIDYNADGTLLLSASSGDAMRIWDAQTGEELRSFGADAGISTAVFAADGIYAFTGSEDQMMRQWDARVFTLEDIIEWAQQNRYISTFTEEECTRYRIDPCPALSPDSDDA